MYYSAMFKMAVLLLAFADARGQEDGHVNWHFSSLKQSDSEWKLVLPASIDRGWHLYSQSTEQGGPMPTTFVFDKPEGFRLTGKVREMGDLRKGYDSTFMVNVSFYEQSVSFIQTVKVKSKGVVKGEINYAVCSEEMCIPGSVRFSLNVGL